MILQVFGAFMATFCFSFVFFVPKSFIFDTSFIGGFGWFIYLLLQKEGCSIVISAFLAAFCIAVLSHCFARWKKAPVTVFFVTGILPLVPGLALYRMVYQLLTGKWSLANGYFVQTLQLAGVIALALFIVDTMMQSFKKQ